MAAAKKITAKAEAEILRRRGAGERIVSIADDFGIAHQTVSKLVKRAAAKQAIAIDKQLRAQADRKIIKRRPPTDLDRDNTPDRKPELAREQPAESDTPEPERGRLLAGPLGSGGVPIFPNTPEGQAERLAYYEARKLNHLPDSLLDYHDVIHGRETPAERRSREGRATGRRR